jgi:hypothetical protein
MTSKRLTVLGLVLGGVLVLYALVWAATGNGPYYAEPAWDQKQAAATRFIVLTDWNSEAVLDRESGLVWEQTPSGASAGWSSARGTCANLSKGGRKGWRLPAFDELASLVDPSQSTPALPASHPFTIGGQVYWSATTNFEDSTQAWIVNFQGSSSVAPNPKVAGLLTWCVRGGGPLSEY